MKTDFDIVDLVRLIPIVILGIVGAVEWTSLSGMERLGLGVLFLFLWGGWFVQGQFRDVKAQLKRIEGRLKEISEDLEERLKEEARDIREKLEKISQDLSVLREEIADLSGNGIDDLRGNKIDGLRGKLGEMSSDLYKLQIEIDDIGGKNRIDDLRGRLEVISSDLYKLKFKIDDQHVHRSPKVSSGGLRLIENHVHYNAGLQSGREDRQAGKPFDPNRHAEYKDGRYHAAWKLGYDEAYGRHPATSAAELDELLCDL